MIYPLIHLSPPEFVRAVWWISAAHGDGIWILARDGLGAEPGMLAFRLPANADVARQKRVAANILADDEIGRRRHGDRYLSDLEVTAIRFPRRTVVSVYTTGKWFDGRVLSVRERFVDAAMQNGARSATSVRRFLAVAGRVGPVLRDLYTREMSDSAFNERDKARMERQERFVVDAARAAGLTDVCFNGVGCPVRVTIPGARGNMPGHEWGFG